MHQSTTPNAESEGLVILVSRLVKKWIWQWNYYVKLLRSPPTRCGPLGDGDLPPSLKQKTALTHNCKTKKTFKRRNRTRSTVDCVSLTVRIDPRLHLIERLHFKAVWGEVMATNMQILRATSRCSSLINDTYPQQLLLLWLTDLWGWFSQWWVECLSITLRVYILYNPQLICYGIISHLNILSRLCANVFCL